MSLYRGSSRAEQALCSAHRQDRRISDTDSSCLTKELTMKLHLLLAATLLLSIAPTLSAKDDITKELITSSGKTRAYYLYIPSPHKPGTPAPLIVMLHGSGRTVGTLV